MSIHFPLQADPVWSAAPKLGVDLATEIRNGALTPDDLTIMLRDCAQCWNQRKCRQWQSVTQVPKATQMPGYCPIGDRLNALARPQG